MQEEIRFLKEKLIIYWKYNWQQKHRSIINEGKIKKIPKTCAKRIKEYRERQKQNNDIWNVVMVLRQFFRYIICLC